MTEGKKKSIIMLSIFLVVLAVLGSLIVIPIVLKTDYYDFTKTIVHYSPEDLSIEYINGKIVPANNYKDFVLMALDVNDRTYVFSPPDFTNPYKRIKFHYGDKLTLDIVQPAEEDVVYVNQYITGGGSRCYKFVRFNLIERLGG